MAASPTIHHALDWRDSAGVGASPACEDARPRAALQHLVMLRLAALLAQAVTIAAADQLFHVELPVRALMAVLAAMALFDALTWLRLREARAVTEGELLRQLCVDVLGLTAVLGLAGGASNPFAGIILLPVAVGATALSGVRAWTLAMVGIAGYSVLLLLAQPIVIAGAEADRLLLLSAGMWVSYSVTAGVIVTVLVRTAIALRRGEQLIERARRQAACDEHILRIGALAAGAAHELSSPLGSIATIVEDLRRAPPEAGQLAHDLEIASRQLASCRQTLATLLCYGNSAFRSRGERIALDDFMRCVLDSFAGRRPDATVTLRLECAGRAPVLMANAALRQALTNLLDNAADVSPRSIEVSLAWDSIWMHIRIRDRGPGVPQELGDRVGKLLFFTTKERGRGNGLGLYLANTAVMRMGGTFVIGNAVDGGAECHIVLPASQPLAPAAA